MQFSDFAKINDISVICHLIGLGHRFAQEKITGPLLKEFGETYTVPQPDIPVDTTATYRVVFDIAKSPENPAKLNPYFNTVARFLNMNTSAGVAQDHLNPVLVVHGSAAFGLLTNQYYITNISFYTGHLKYKTMLFGFLGPVGAISVHLP